MKLVGKRLPHLSRESHTLLKISFLGHTFNDMYWLIIPLVLPLIKNEFKLDYAQSGFLLTSYTLTGAFGSLITGHLGDKNGRRFILSWGFFLGSLALVLCAFSSGYWQIFFALIILGVGISAFHPSMIAVISNKFPLKRGTVLGLFQFWGWVGTFGAVVAISLLIKVSPNWRGILLILSIPGFVFAPLFFKILKPLIQEERENNNKITPASSKDKTATPVFTFLIFLSANTLFVLSYNAVINFIPTYLVEEKSLSLSAASYSFLVVIAAGFIGTILSGKASDDLSPLNTLLAFVGFGGPVIIILTFLQNYILLIIFLVIFGISYSGVWAPQQDYLAKNTPKNSRGKIYGLIFFAINIVGAIAPGITGIIADKFSLPVALRAMSIPIFFSLILLFLLKRKGKNRN